ncbi:MAG: hypothetical protein Q8P41_12605, partial [Pseudomonadota bacterium]|nr:hypothetical protein [Pseudomonadota bacterium]
PRALWAPRAPSARTLGVCYACAMLVLLLACDPDDRGAPPPPDTEDTGVAGIAAGSSADADGVVTPSGGDLSGYVTASTAALDGEVGLFVGTNLGTALLREPEGAASLPDLAVATIEGAAPVVGDQDGDGWDDLVSFHSGPAGDDEWQAHAGVWRGPFVGVQGREDLVVTYERAWEDLEAFYADAALGGDVDGDGADDLLVTELADTLDAVRVGRVPPDASGALVDLPTVLDGLPKASWWILPAGDGDGDGLDDLLLASEGHAIWLPGPLGGAYADADVIVEGGIRDATPGDVDGDGRSDLLVETEGVVLLLPGVPASGDAAAQAVAVLELESGVDAWYDPAVAVATIDGRPTVAIGHTPIDLGEPDGVYVLHGPLAGALPLADVQRWYGAEANQELGVSVVLLDGDDGGRLYAGARGYAEAEGAIYRFDLPAPIATGR